MESSGKLSVRESFGGDLVGLDRGVQGSDLVTEVLANFRSQAVDGNDVLVEERYAALEQARD